MQVCVRLGGCQIFCVGWLVAGGGVDACMHLRMRLYFAMRVYLIVRSTDTCVVAQPDGENVSRYRQGQKLNVGADLQRGRRSAVCGLRCDRQASTRRRSHGADASFCCMRVCALSLSDVGLQARMSVKSWCCAQVCSREPCTRLSSELVAFANCKYWSAMRA